MKRIETTTCHEASHPEFVFQFADSVLDRWVEPVVGIAEHMVAAGEVFTPGETVQIGWQVCQVAEADGGRLTFHEQA